MPAHDLSMNRVNPRKLLHSKWTATKPQNKEKHFLVTAMKFTETGEVEHCLFEAAYSGREESIDWRNLRDTSRWLQGWH
jgi:tryptophan-rich hypothetical protein